MPQSPEVQRPSFLSRVKSKASQYGQKTLNAFGHLLSFIGFNRPHKQATVNSQVTDVHPDGTVTYSQSTNHPSGSHSHTTDTYSGGQPMMNSQVTNMNPGGVHFNSQVTNI